MGIVTKICFKMSKLLNMFSLIVVCFTTVVLAADGELEIQPVGLVNPEHIEMTRPDKAIANFLIDIEVQLRKGILPDGWKKRNGVKLSRGRCEHKEKCWNDSYWGGIVCNCMECCQFYCGSPGAWKTWEKWGDTC